jgi:3-oxoacyl-[acyl-carrier protein] reductase
MSDERLAGIKAIVTGSSRGIGKSIAIAFANHGADVIVNCDESKDQAEEVAGIIKSKGRSCWVCMADVRLPGDCRRLAEFANSKMGRIDVVVNNAGITRDALMQNVQDDDWAGVISTNLTGVMNVTKAVLPMMRAQKSGRVINITSVVGVMGNIGQTSYAASKAGVIGLTKTAARELARDGILVNAIAPGFTNTEMVARIPDDVKEKILKTIPLKRFGEPDEIAKVAVFLASKESSYITGQIVGVNGGLYI